MAYPEKCFATCQAQSDAAKEREALKLHEAEVQEKLAFRAMEVREAELRVQEELGRMNGDVKSHLSAAEAASSEATKLREEAMVKSREAEEERRRAEMEVGRIEEAWRKVREAEEAVLARETELGKREVEIGEASRTELQRLRTRQEEIERHEAAVANHESWVRHPTHPHTNASNPLRVPPFPSSPSFLCVAGTKWNTVFPLLFLP